MSTSGPNMHVHTYKYIILYVYNTYTLYAYVYNTHIQCSIHITHKYINSYKQNVGIHKYNRGHSNKVPQGNLKHVTINCRQCIFVMMWEKTG